MFDQCQVTCMLEGACPVPSASGVDSDASVICELVRPRPRHKCGCCTLPDTCMHQLHRSSLRKGTLHAHGGLGSGTQRQRRGPPGARMAGLDKPLVAALSKAPGVGPTTCSKLLQQCGTLAALAAHTQQVGRRGDPTFFQGSCMTMWLWHSCAGTCCYRRDCRRVRGCGCEGVQLLARASTGSIVADSTTSWYATLSHSSNILLRLASKQKHPGGGDKNRQRLKE